MEPLKQSFSCRQVESYGPGKVSSEICEGRPEQSHVGVRMGKWFQGASVPRPSWKRWLWLWTYKQGGNESEWGGSFMSVILVFTSSLVWHQRGFLVPASWSHAENIGRVTQKNDKKLLGSWEDAAWVHIQGSAMYVFLFSAYHYCCLNTFQ